MKTALTAIFPLEDDILRKLPPLRLSEQGGGLVAPECSSLPCLVLSPPAPSSPRSLVLQTALSFTQDGEVLVVLGGPRWTDGLPPTVHRMASPAAENMSRLSFLYPSNTSDLISFICSSTSLPRAIVVSDIHLIVERSLKSEDKSDRGFCRGFARLSALLADFASHCSARAPGGMEDPTRLVVFSCLRPGLEMSSFQTRLELWYPEVWQVEPGGEGGEFVCLTSDPHKVRVKFSMRGALFYLDSVSY